MRLLGPIACRKVCRNTAETRKTISLSFWIVGFQFQLFLQTIGLDAATSSPLTGLRSIVLPLELNVRVKAAGHRRRWCCRCSCPVGRRDKFAKSLRKQESRSRNTRNVRKKWSVYFPPRLWECQLRSCALAYSLLRTWKETTISWGIHFMSIIQWEAFWKALGIELKEKILSQVCAANEKRGRKNVRGAGRLAVVTLEDQLLKMTRLRIRLGWLQQELAYIFDVSEACVSLTFQEVD